MNSYIVCGPVFMPLLRAEVWIIITYSVPWLQNFQYVPLFRIYISSAGFLETKSRYSDVTKQRIMQLFFLSFLIKGELENLSLEVEASTSLFQHNAFPKL
jgi:hypothetical protein